MYIFIRRCKVSASLSYPFSGMLACFSFIFSDLSARHALYTAIFNCIALLLLLFSYRSYSCVTVSICGSVCVCVCVSLSAAPLFDFSFISKICNAPHVAATAAAAATPRAACPCRRLPHSKDNETMRSHSICFTRPQTLCHASPPHARPRPVPQSQPPSAARV